MRPKFYRFFNEEHIQLALEIIEMNGLFVSTNSLVNDCRDAKDNYLLSLAIDGNAGYLLTGDKDLLVLNKIGNTYIKTISEFSVKNLN